MKKINKYITFLFLVLGIAIFSACSTDYDEPPLDEPKYTPSTTAKVIDVKTFKEMFKDVEDNGNKVISGPYVLKATVSGNDVSGNIFKQLYVQDYDFNDTNLAQEGLYLGVDQTNVCNVYVVGQEVFVELDGLSAVRYGGQLQVGNATTNANRIPWQVFRNSVHRNGWANPTKMLPKVATIGGLTPAMANTLVKFDNVVFTEGGEGNFIVAGNSYTEQAFSDGTGTIIIRTSQYFNNLKGKKLPSGKGSLTGIIGLHNSTWQLVLRDTSDIGEFSGTVEPEPEPAGVIFHETFGTPSKDSETGFWPNVDTYTGYSAKNVTYSDPYAPAATIRNHLGLSNVWLPAGKDAGFKIEGIPANEKGLVLTYKMLNNSKDVAENASVIEVKANGALVSVPTTALSNDAWTTITLSLPDNTTSIEFYSAATRNTVGIRIADIKLVGGGDSPTPEPVLGVYKETFGKPVNSGGWPLVGVYTDYTMKSPIEYSDASGRASIRINSGISHVWFPASNTDFPNSYLTVKNINTSSLTNAVISFDIAANTYDAGSSINLNVLKVKANGTTLTIPSKEVSQAAGDANKFYSFSVEGFPIAENVTLEFTSDPENTLGLRLANIVIEEKK